MPPTVRLVLGCVAATALLAACSGDPVAPQNSLNTKVVAAAPAASSGGGGSGVKPPCTNTLDVSASVAQALTGNAFTASTVLNACQSRTHVSLTVTDVTTGAQVYSVPDLLGTVALWTLPYKKTTYRVDARAFALNAVVATASTTVTTTIDLPPCDAVIHESVTVGYWGIYPAVWAATDAQDCGQGGFVHLVITNMNTGKVELDYGVLPTTSLVDFEGAIVSYNTPYHVYAELRSSTGEVRATSSSDIVSAPQR